MSPPSRERFAPIEPSGRVEPTSRRRFLQCGTGAAGALLLAGASTAEDAAASGSHATRGRAQHGRLPAEAIQDIVGIEGSVSGGVLSMSVARSDIGDVIGPMDVTFKPAFQISGDLTFQPLSDTRAFFNGDLALRASELNPVVDAIHASGLTFQAMHQHYFGMRPQIWFIHFRGEGDAKALAAAVRRVIQVTAAPLPQSSPKHPRDAAEPRQARDDPQGQLGARARMASSPSPSAAGA